MTDDAIEKPTATEERITVEHRLDVLEARCSILEKACRVAFGKAWMEQVGDDVAKGDDGN